MAEKSKSKGAKTRKTTVGKSKGKGQSGVEVLLEDIRDKMGELASEAEVIIKEAGSASKKTAGRALEGTKKKAGEAAAHLPVVGDGKKAAPKRATSAKAGAAKSSAAKSSNGASKSATGKKKAPASAKSSAAKSSAGSKSKKS